MQDAQAHECQSSSGTNWPGSTHCTGAAWLRICLRGLVIRNCSLACQGRTPTGERTSSVRLKPNGMIPRVASYTDPRVCQGTRRSHQNRSWYAQPFPKTTAAPPLAVTRLLCSAPSEAAGIPNPDPISPALAILLRNNRIEARHPGCRRHGVTPAGCKCG